MSSIPNEWQLQEAKSKLSHLVREADKGTPQYITVQGKKAVLISVQEYRKLKQPESTLSSALLTPLLGNQEDWFTRDQDTGRSLDL